jgi:hypothetical protein
METTSITITVPPYAAARGRAQDLCSAQLPDDLQGTHVVLDAAGLSILGQGFLDELCKQVLGVRAAAEFEVNGATERMGEHLTRSARLRGYPERLTVTTGR